MKPDLIEYVQDLEQRVRLLEQIFIFGKLVVPTSDWCPLTKQIDDYQWYIDCHGGMFSEKN